MLTVADRLWYNGCEVVMRVFYVIKTVGRQYKTGSTEKLERRLKTFLTSSPRSVVVDKWPCPGGVIQEHKAQRKMQNHPCCKWIGGENFEVHNEQVFISELRTFFGEPALVLPTYAEKFFGVTLPRYR